MQLRELAAEEYEQGLALAWDVFCSYEAPEYSAQGVEAFRTAIHDPAFTGQLRMYGAYLDERLVGVLATRNAGAHIALFFVDGAFHRQGIGKSLFALAVGESALEKMTVNSSPYAVEVYHRLGFMDTAPEQVTDGIRYIPMECRLRNAQCPCKRTRCSRHGNCVLCREHHHSEKQKPVFCERPDKRERRRRER